MREGDEVMIVCGDHIQFLGRIAGTVVSPELSTKLWHGLDGTATEPWSLIYFIANPRELRVPFRDFCRLVGYQTEFQLRGLTAVSENRLADFYARYDDLYSILIRLQEHRTFEEVHADPGQAAQGTPEAAHADAPSDDVVDGAASEHLQMQYLLLKMGRAAGEKVWVPKPDQSRIGAKFKFTEFEATFSAGLDTQAKFVQNIDVVWKEEFRIDAAFEIENSTAIYSGLLRFADLTMVAPNTLYPMFIVAPGERRNRVKEQLLRPSFKSLHLGEKVRYLSYEKVREVDDFFADDGRGLSVEVLLGKAEDLVK